VGVSLKHVVYVSVNKYKKMVVLTVHKKFLDGVLLCGV